MSLLGYYESTFTSYPIQKRQKTIRVIMYGDAPLEQMIKVVYNDNFNFWDWFLSVNKLLYWKPHCVQFKVKKLKYWKLLEIRHYRFERAHSNNSKNYTYFPRFQYFTYCISYDHKKIRNMVIVKILSKYKGPNYIPCNRCQLFSYRRHIQCVGLIDWWQ